MAHHFINTNTAIIYDRVVAAGAAFNTGVLDVSTYKNLMLVVTNSDAGTRTLQVAFFLEDGTTAIYGPINIRTVGIGATETLTVGPGVTTGVTAAFAYSVIPTRVRYNVTAAGTSDFRLTIYAR
jgi:hypothetical protein